MIIKETSMGRLSDDLRLIHANQAAAMYGRTCRQKLSDMGNYSELDR